MADTPQSATVSHAPPLDRVALDALDQRIMQLELNYPTITDEEIGDEIGLGREAVNRRRNAQKYQAKINSFLAEPLETIKAALSKAARVVVKALDSQDEKVRVTAAFKILMSEGIIKQKVETDNANSDPMVFTLPNSQQTIIVSPNGKAPASVEQKN